MIPYWILFSIFAVGAFVYDPSAQRARQAAPMFFVAGIFVALMIGLRYRVGVDWTNYVRIYQELWWQDFDEMFARGDPLFYIPMWQFAKAEFQIWAFFLLCAVVFTAGLFAFAKRQPNPWLAVLVAVPFLIIAVAMSGVRQATAIGFFFFALVALADRSAARFLGWMLCAGACHGSAILMAPLAGLSFTRNRIQSAFLMLLMAVVAYFTLRTPFENYSQDYLQGTLESAGAVYRLGMNAIPAVLFLIYMKKFRLAEPERVFWRNMSLLALVSLPLLSFISSTALDRIGLYIFPLQLFVLSALPSMLSSAETRRFLVMFLIVFYLFAIQFVFLNYAINRDPYVPYRFWPLTDTSIDLASAGTSPQPSTWLSALSPDPVSTTWSYRGRS
jgi:hypothetical protein